MVINLNHTLGQLEVQRLSLVKELEKDEPKAKEVTDEKKEDLKLFNYIGRFDGSR